VAVSVVDCPTQMVGLLTVIVGIGFIVSVVEALAVAFAPVHPFAEPETVYVIVVVPSPIVVITPLGLTAATAVFDDDQVPPASPLDDKVVVAPWHKDETPLITPAFGPDKTVIVIVAKSDPEQDPDPFTVYVIVAEPAATPVTTPELLTVATEVLEVVHAPPASPFEVIDVVLPTHTLAVPLNVPASGPVVTVMESVARSDPEQEPDPLTVYEIVAEPTETPVTTPEALTVAMEVFDEVHAPPASPFDVMVVVFPTHTLAVPLNVPASGPAVTVMESVARSDPVHGAVAFIV
jgi:hypothetical protein